MPQVEKQIPLYTIKTKEMSASEFDIIDLRKKYGELYDSTSAHRHTFFELFFFCNGQGSHEIDFERYPVEANSLHFVSPGQIHHLVLRNTKGFVLCFTEDFISIKSKESFTDNFPFYDPSNIPVLKLGKTQAAELFTIVSLIYKEAASSVKNKDIIRSYLNVILLKLKGQFLENEQKGGAKKPPRKNIVTQFKKLVNTHYLLFKSTADYADKLNISTNHLNALCRKHEAKTASRIIQERTLLEAKRLLYGTDINIQQVAYYLKFDDTPYFNRFFKKLSGETPKEYRLRALKNR